MHIRKKVKENISFFYWGGVTHFYILLKYSLIKLTQRGVDDERRAEVS